MKPITEKYVTFKIAKLLREQGFPHFHNEFVDIRGSWSVFPSGEIELNSCVGEAAEIQYPAPEHWQLIEWFRNEYDIEIEVYRTTKSETGENYGVQILDWSDEYGIDGVKDLYNDYFSSPEEAYEAAFEFCLTGDYLI